MTWPGFQPKAILSVRLHPTRTARRLLPMWRTSQGERVLKGAEWNLFREGLAELWDTVEDDFDRKDACKTGHAAFDALQPGQKLAMLALVGQALHDDALPSPEP